MTVDTAAKKRFINYLLDVVSFVNASRTDDILNALLNSEKLEKIHFVKSFEGIDPELSRLMISQTDESRGCEFFMDHEEGTSLRRFQEILESQLEDEDFVSLYILLNFNTSTEEYMDRNYNYIFEAVALSQEELNNVTSEFEKMNYKNFVLNQIDEALDKRSKRNFNKWTKELKGLESNG